MSIGSNKGPMQKIPHSGSNKSLFTENSEESDDAGKQIPASRKLIELQHEVHAQEPNPHPKQEQLPKIPTQKVPPSSNTFNTIDDRIISHIPEGFSRHGRRKLNEEQSKPSNESQRYHNLYEDNAWPRMTGISGTSKAKESSQRQRMLRSSQGGRWLRSYSLMAPQQKQASSTNFHNFQSYQSKYTQLYQRYVKDYSHYEKQLKKLYNYQFGLCLDDTLENIKNRMEAYLEKRIDLSNMSIDRPDAQWKQEEFTKFYLNYSQILKKKLELEHELPGTIILKKYKNCAYYGPIKQGKKHGFGYLHYFSGKFFEGLFEDDQKIEGFQMDDQELYLGKWKKNQRSGQGILKTNQHMIYGVFTNGEFSLPKQEAKHNTIHKRGFKIQFSQVTFYPGHHQQFAIQKNGNGDLYIGELNGDNQKHGLGLEVFANGDLYIGKYEQGIPEGYGEYYWESGAFYRGDFLSGMRHGKGKWMMINGDKYEGQYLNDKKNGHGTYYWKSGDRYVGEFENDYRHGYGEMYWRDGGKYKGKWLNGIEINKTIKLESKKQQVKRPSGGNKGLPLMKNLHKTIQPRKRGSAVGTSIIQKNKIQEDNRKRVSLQKLKSILNPSNSIN